MIAEHLLDETEPLNSVGGKNETFTRPAAATKPATPVVPTPRGAVPIKKARDI